MKRFTDVFTIYKKLRDGIKHVSASDVVNIVNCEVAVDLLVGIAELKDEEFKEKTDWTLIFNEYDWEDYFEGLTPQQIDDLTGEEEGLKEAILEFAHALNRIADINQLGTFKAILELYKIDLSTIITTSKIEESKEIIDELEESVE